MSEPSRIPSHRGDAWRDVTARREAEEQVRDNPDLRQVDPDGLPDEDSHGEDDTD